MTSEAPPSIPIAILDVPAQPQPPQPQQPLPQPDLHLERMFALTLLPLARHPRRLLRWLPPLAINAILGVATFCPLYYPSYYPNQALVWSTDIGIGWVIYNYMFFLHRRWEKANFHETVTLPRGLERVTMGFFCLYIVYWFYFAVIQFSVHNEPSAAIQLGNTLMSTAWYFFFALMATLYYAICIKLAQRAEAIRLWLKSLKHGRLPLLTFFEEYNVHYRKIKEFGKYWNFLIFFGMLLLGFHVPIDAVSILYAKNYYDIYGLVLKLLSLGWYVWQICGLNEYEPYLVSYLYKHRVYELEDMKKIENYTLYRPLGLNFYGIKINKSLVIKVLLLVFNLIVPTLYALLSNQVFRA